MGIKLIDKINAEQTAGVKDKNYPEFRTGDIVRVSIKIKEGDKFRVQDFEGKVLAVSADSRLPSCIPCANGSRRTRTSLNTTRKTWPPPLNTR